MVSLQEYNTIADRLQLIPRTAKRAGGIQFEAKLNRAGSSPLELINVDLKVKVLTTLDILTIGYFVCCSQQLSQSLQRANTPFSITFAGIQHIPHRAYLCIHQ